LKNLEQPVIFTSNAQNELLKLRKSLDLKENQFLRVGVKGGGCSGMSYQLAFDTQEETDTRYTSGGIDLIINKAHVMYVLGMEIDYENGLNNRGFSFNNPNATESCGCGTSFAV
jgi:iron-sulfur cluster assembly protein